jgi:signal transduction histidine kinase
MRTRWWQRPTIADIALALVLTVFAQIDLWANLENADHYGPDGLVAACTLVATGTLMFRRVAPTVTALVVAGVVGVPELFTVLTFQLWGDFLPLLVAAYSVCRYRPARDAMLGCAAVVTAVVLVFLRVPAVQALGNVPMAAIPLAAAIVTGWALRTREAKLHSVVEQAQRFKADREAAIAAAVAEEHTRIARELHDIVAHSVTVMVIQAGAAENLISRDPPAALGYLASVQETGRQAVADLHRLLGLLRGTSPTAALQPQPRIADLGDLIAHFVDAGLPVAVTVDGVERRLTPGVELTVYRVVQEALTNVMKHGAPGSAHVLIRYQDNGITVRISDDGRATGNPSPANSRTPAPDPDEPMPRVGHGLVGMQERAALFGGSLAAGPDPRGGFVVLLTLPIDTPGSMPDPERDVTEIAAHPAPPMTGAVP